MTLYGWDASHYQGSLTVPILARAKAEGYIFFTHKIAEGLSDTEGTHDDTALAAARSVGFEFVGGYLVPRSNTSVAAQVTEWIQLADQGERWWRDYPGWFWQIDLERWSYDNVPASVGIACAQELRGRTGRWTVLYASHGQYGDQLTGWDGPLWNANYPTGAAGAASTLYERVGGDTGAGWAPYSGKTPAIWQFTSSATIAGLGGCDANAYRGSLDDLRALITGDTMGLTDQQAYNIEHYLYCMYTGRDADGIYDPAGNRITVANSVASRLNDLEQKVAAAPTGGAPATATLTDAQMADLKTSVTADLATTLGGAIARLQAAQEAQTAALAALAVKVTAAGHSLES